jgi:DNA modification methylase
VELRHFQAFGEPGAIVYLADCVDLMKIIPSGSVDVVFADPPYRLSRGGVTVKSGRLAPVDKGAWDRSTGFAEDHRFNVRWLKEACRILKPDGTIWVTGTHHIIFSLGFALQTMKFKLINVNRSEYKPPSCELQDLRRGRRCPASRIGQSLEEGGATRADSFSKSPRDHRWRVYARS